MGNIPVERIKRRVVVPFAVTMTIVLAVAVGSMFFIERQSRLDRFDAELYQAQHFFEDLLEVESRHLRNELTLISRDPALRDAFARHDRDALLRLATPLFESFKATSGVTHFYFFSSDQRVFLRVHHPSFHGDLPQMATVRYAVQTRQPAHGLELGTYGHLSLRVVQPWVVDGEIIGYLEFAKEVGGVAALLRHILKAEVFIAVSKEHLDRGRWEEGQRILGYHGSWDELPGAVVIGRTMASVPPEIGQELGGKSTGTGVTFLRKIGGRHYSVGLSPLIDVGGTTIGTIMVMFDVTGERQSLLTAMLVLVMLVSIFAVGGLLFFWRHIDRLDRRLVAIQEQQHDRLRHSTDLLQADIIKRQEVEREYDLVCQRNALILDSAGQGIFGLDAEGRHTFVNPAAAAMLGYAIEELIGQKSHALCHHTRPDGTPYVEAECPIYQAFKDGKPHHVEEDVFWRKDGSQFWVEYTSTPIRDGDHLVGAVVAFQDITARKEAAVTLTESEERYRIVIETAHDAVLMMDAAGRVALWNPAAEKIFGYRAEEIIGQPLHDALAAPRYREKSKLGIEHFRIAGTGAAVGKTLALQGLRKNGEVFPLELTLSALRRHGEWWAVGLIRDISERVAAEAERENLQAQIRQAQKMEAIGTLAGGIAHDFNNILGAIIGYAELAMLDAGQGRPLDGHLAEIRRAGDRAKELVAHILTFSRQTEMRRQPMDVTPIIKEAMKLLRASLPANIELRQEIVPAPGKIMADPVQVHQCLMNLCTNAARAMRDTGGVLEVSMAEEDLADAAMLTEHGLAAGRYLRISVRDTGHGMDEQTREHIFEPFFSTRERGESTGLGLSVVHGIVKSHGGAITVASAVGAGATFRLYFPLLAAAKAGPEVSAAVSAVLPSGQKERVLLVDDEAQLVELGQRILDYLGYVVTPMMSSTEALALFAAQPDAFDLVISDQSMPVMTGVEMARQMLAIRPELPVVLCTGFSETVSEQQARAVGIRGYVMKPLSINDLAAACRDALAGHK